MQSKASTGTGLAESCEDTLQLSGGPCGLTGKAQHDCPHPSPQEPPSGLLHNPCQPVRSSCRWMDCKGDSLLQ
ncbi:mCG67449 [Mus musculus]|nr:mCG67449 [Mus musculus]